MLIFSAFEFAAWKHLFYSNAVMEKSDGKGLGRGIGTGHGQSLIHGKVQRHAAQQVQRVERRPGADDAPFPVAAQREALEPGFAAAGVRSSQVDGPHRLAGQRAARAAGR